MAFTDWAEELLRDVAHAAALLDGVHQTSDHRSAVTLAQARLANPEMTPSARVLREMRAAGKPFCAYTMAQSTATLAHFQQGGLKADRLAEMRQVSRLSLERQSEIEATDTMSFEAFVQQWNLAAESRQT